MDEWIALWCDSGGQEMLTFFVNANPARVAKYKATKPEEIVVSTRFNAAWSAAIIEKSGAGPDIVPAVFKNPEELKAARIGFSRVFARNPGGSSDDTEAVVMLVRRVLREGVF
jgi:hypothetical protein